jgi:hypothetical protein
MTSDRELTQYKRQISTLRRRLESTDSPEDAINIGAGAGGIEETMRASGLYSTKEIRPVRELFLDARWTLGGFLRKLDKRVAGKRRGSEVTDLPQKKAELKRLGLTSPTAVAAERINTLPKKEKAKTYADTEKQDVLPTIELLIDVARPYWFQASRKDKHRNIANKARKDQAPDSFGPFPLIYADPPWKFDVYSEKGLDRTPDQHLASAGHVLDPGTWYMHEDELWRM